MSLKDVSYLELLAPAYLPQNQLDNVGKGIMRNILCVLSLGLQTIS